jgi:hypothetical protein
MFMFMFMFMGKKKVIKTAKDIDKAILELDAIDSVRLEIANAMKRGASGIEITELRDRLVSLYDALDGHNIVSIIHKIAYSKVA